MMDVFNPYSELSRTSDAGNNRVRRVRIFDIINSLKQYGSFEAFCDHYNVVSATNGHERLCVVLVCCRKDLDQGKKRAALWRRNLNEKGLLERVNVIPIVGNDGEGSVFDLVDGALEVRCNDFYEGLPEKILGAFLYVLLATGARSVLKIDANIDIVDWALLLEHIQRYEQVDADIIGFIRKEEWGFNRYWHFGKCSSEALNSRRHPRTTYIWPDGGRGYLVKRQALKAIFTFISCPKNRFELGNYIYEDAMIGELMYRAQIKFFSENFTGAFLDDHESSSNTRF